MSKLLLLPLTFLLLGSAQAGSVNENGGCSLSRNRLEVGTYQFSSDCDSTTYCAADNTCKKRQCRRADFPFGYSPNSKVPDKCHKGTFCPDEESDCQELLPVGSDCQLNRDDECEAPPNFEVLADTTKRGLNVNGSVCLNNKCMWANVTEGDTCVVENTAYIAYGEHEFSDIVSRGNCRVGLYCDSQSLKCNQEKNLGEGCNADKECATMNCLSSGVCGASVGTARHIALWVYIVVAIGILAGMFGTLIALFIFHRRQRDEEREKRVQYWREQNAFHQNLMQMREAARASILSLPRGSGGTQSNRSSTYGDDLQMPILQHAAAKPSGLRNYMSDADESSSVEYDDGLMLNNDRKDGRF